MCQPQEITIKRQAMSLYNLKSHVKRKHPVHAIQFEERIEARSSLGNQSSGSSVSSYSSQPYAKKAYQTSISQVFAQTACTSACQSMVDRRIVDLFVNNMLPLHVVESSTLVGLIKMLNLSKMLMSCRTLCRIILASHTQLEKYLTRYSYWLVFKFFMERFPRQFIGESLLLEVPR
ncbi:Hypothetical predicted protein [Octopus vulgaris]|uniref:Uncharacterized protein n=1 Tax=Octopus vulgaris TaxID=6645 RepID=A0AA36BES9_OCTVU|nr:Hypothetical predicted protein [Octopus vulgaris]